MPYPTVSEIEAQKWYGAWKRQTIESDPFKRQPVPDITGIGSVNEGIEVDWDSLAACIVSNLLEILETKGEAAFESEGAVVIHSLLPDHVALRDPEFWIWFATVPGRELIDRRYPFKAPEDELPPFYECSEVQKKARQKESVPGRDNYLGKGSRETLYFRLWVRAEMARVLDGDPDSQYEFVYPGMIDFWRSHVFRQIFAHHRPFLHAFVDFQFPERNEDGGRYKSKLPTAPIRQLAKDLSKTCANLIVELLDEAECRSVIETVWSRTEMQAAWKVTKEERAAE